MEKFDFELELALLWFINWSLITLKQALPRERCWCDWNDRTEHSTFVYYTSRFKIMPLPTGTLERWTGRTQPFIVKSPAALAKTGNSFRNGFTLYFFILGRVAGLNRECACIQPHRQEIAKSESIHMQGIGSQDCLAARACVSDCVLP